MFWAACRPVWSSSPEAIPSIRPVSWSVLSCRFRWSRRWSLSAPPRLQPAGQRSRLAVSGQEALARQFATPGVDKFQGVTWEPAPATGAPLLEGVAAWIDCRIHERYEAGDHWLVLGEVVELSLNGNGGALVFHGGAFRPLA
jgi:hypothetical protein